MPLRRGLGGLSVGVGGNLFDRPGFFDSSEIGNLTVDTQLLLKAAAETYGIIIAKGDTSGASQDYTLTIPAMSANAELVTTNATQTLTNKTLGDLRLTDVLDSNGNELFKFTATGSAVNEITLANAAAGNPPVFSSTGSDTNIDIKLQPKGSGKVHITGGLEVDGTTTTIDSTTLTVDDKNIEMGSVASPSDTTADGGGITLKGATDKTIIWDNSNDNWTSNQDWNIASGKSFKINNAVTLNATTLGSAVVTSSLTTVGTLGSGAISSGFGAIDIGTSALSAGALTIDNISIDGNTISSSSGNITFNAASSLDFGDDSVLNVGTITLDIIHGDNNAIQVGDNSDDAVSIYRVNALTAIGDLDIGAHDLRAATITPDGLTAGQVVYTGTAGVLSAESGFEYNTSSNTLTVNTITPTTINAFTLGGKLTAGSSEIEGSAFDINGGAIDAVTIGTNSVATEIRVDNLTLNGNTISTTDTNGAMILAPHGTGDVQLDADTVRVGDADALVLITSNGTGSLKLNTNAGTNSGHIQINSGANGAIDITPDGTGDVNIPKVDIDSGTVDAITSLTIANNVDVGNYTVRANNFLADSHTATRVFFAGTDGVLTSDSDFTFATDTLTVTKLGAFEATGAIDFSDEAMTNVNIDSGAIDGVTLGTNSVITQAVIDNVTINGATIGHTSDTDLMTVADGVLTVAGELDATTLDISGNADIDGTLEADAITVDGTALDEFIADTIGGMVTSNTESGITVAYQDADNTLDFTVGTLNQDTTGTAAIATAVTITDNESTNEENAVIFAAGGDVDGGNLGLESDGNLTYNPSTGTLTATTFSGSISGSIADITVSANNSTDETVYPIFVDGATGAQGAESDTGLTYNPSSGVLTSTSFAGTATNATHVTVADNESTNENNLIPFIENASATGNVGLESDGDFHYNPSTGTLTATTFSGAFSGTVTDATNVTVSANNSTDETVYPTFVDGATGAQGIETDTGLTYNPSSGLLTISGELVAGSLDISGNTDIDGTLEADAYTVDGTALNEYIADTVGAMVGSNTETGVAVTYEDGDNTLDFVLGAAQTTITSVYNTSLKMGRDADNLIDFATTDNKIILRVNGVNEVELVENALSPVTSDGVTLGTSSLMWGDLFVASGGVLNFNAGDMTITHSSNTLTVAGGTLAAGTVDIDGGAIDGAVIGANSAAAGTFAAIVGTTIDASTDFTVGDTIITNGTITDSTGLSIAAAVDLGSNTLTSTGSMQIRTIDYSDGDLAITIADGGGITAAAGITSTAASNSFGATSFGDANITEVGIISLDTIASDGSNIGFGTDGSGEDVYFYSATSGDHMFWDASDEKLVITGTDGQNSLEVADGNVTITDNLTVSGNFTVSGTTTTVDTTNLTVTDPLIKLAQGTTASPASDLGIIFTRGNGSSTNIANRAILWDESADIFVFANTNDEAGTTTGNVDIDDYASIRVGAITADDNSTFTGTISTATGSTIGNLTLANGSITDSSGAISFGDETLTTTGVITAAGFTIGSAAIVETELEMIDGITAGTAAASKAVVLDGSKNIATIGTIGSGAITSSGVVTATGFTIGSAAITEAELEILDGASVTTAELNLIAGGTARGTDAIADGDGVLINDAGTMRMTTVQTLAAYLDDEITAMPNLTTLAGLTTIGAVSNTLAMTFGDVTLYDDNNNADVSFKMGTGSAESLTIQVLNGGSNKTAEEVHFSTATASGTADHGKMVFDIDGTDILTIDDGGLVIKTTGTIGPVGDEDLLTLTASGSIVTVAGELSVTTLDIGGTNVTSTAAELNILEGATVVVGEINALDLGATAVGTAIASKAVILDSNKDYTGIRNLTIDGTFSDGNYTFDTNGNVSGLGTVGSGNITSSGTVQGTTITATTAFVPDASDGAALGTTSLEFSDLYLADEAVIGFGDDQEVTLTHVHNAGLLLSSTDKLQFGDAGTFIHQSADGVLTIESDTTVDINGAVVFNGALTGITNITLSGTLSDGNYTFDTSGNVSGLGTVASGAITSTGVITGTTVEATGDTSAGDNAAAGYTAAEGLILTGQGSTTDITIKNDADATVISVPTGTTNTVLEGNTGIGTSTMTQKLNVDGKIHSEDIRYIQVALQSPDTDAATGTPVAQVAIPTDLNGMKLVEALAVCADAGDGNTTITIENHDDDATLCDTITLADSSRAAAGANYSASTVSTNDMLHINVTAVATDPPEGIIVTLGFAHTVS